MALENAQHPVRMPAARRKPSLFRRAELLQMQIADAVLIEPGGELAFRKPRPARCRDGTYIDQEPDLCLRQRIEKCGRGRLLIADGEQGFHDICLSQLYGRICLSQLYGRAACCSARTAWNIAS